MRLVVIGCGPYKYIEVSHLFAVLPIDRHLSRLSGHSYTSLKFT